ncbi:hypothetical protein BDD12DRAFT_836395 [Trichophaea hybrida]|nr:hypothetical protein BDD12DRAFT_836395 [Trichophaea hybrida]
MFRLTPRFLPSLTLSTRRLARSTSKIPHKDSLNPTSKETTRSGTNDEIAHDDAAYNSDTNPASQKAAAGKEEGLPPSGAQNPLEYSPATPEVSYQVRDERSVKGGEKKPSGGSKNA